MTITTAPRIEIERDVVERFISDVFFSHEDVAGSECATLRGARKRLRTCGELWPDNEPAWCEQCRMAQKRGAGS
jgi:hypothetical protein